MSTVGLVPEMRHFAAHSRAQLAVSLHATTDEARHHSMIHGLPRCDAIQGWQAPVLKHRFTTSDARALSPRRCLLLHASSHTAVLLAGQVRDWLCPVNRRWPLAVLLGALARDFPRGVTTSRHFVLIEYVMLLGVNDTVDDAHRWS